MTSQDRKDFPASPSAGATAARASASPREAEINDETLQRTFPAGEESPAPFVPARGAVLDGTEVEAVRTSENEVEPSMAPNTDIENIGGEAPEQIDPGAGGKPVI